MAAKTAKSAKRVSKPRRPAASLPAVLPVRVRWTSDTYYIARARGMSCSCASSTHLAVRGLASKLGYSKHADVRYFRMDEDGSQIFEIVEADPPDDVASMQFEINRALAYVALRGNSLPYVIERHHENPALIKFRSRP